MVIIPGLGELKLEPEDFNVEEILGFDLSGGGEHVWLYIEKTLLNTQELQREIATLANVRRFDVGYSGLKDKVGVTRQWFSVYLPNGNIPNWSSLNSDKVRVLRIDRHYKKLRVGTHQSNKFKIITRNCNFDNILEVDSGISYINNNGFINLFGEQRFGADNHNLDKALGWIEGAIKIKSKKDRGFLLSVLRSFLFNKYIEMRGEKRSLRQVILGDVVGFPGANTWFHVDSSNIDEVQSRCNNHELVIAGVLYGKNRKLSVSDDSKVLLDDLLVKYPWSQKLLDYDIDVMYRAVLSYPKDLMYCYDENNSLLTFSFTLNRGSYATVLLHRLLIV